MRLVMAALALLAAAATGNEEAPAVMPEPLGVNRDVEGMVGCSCGWWVACGSDVRTVYYGSVLRFATDFSRGTSIDCGGWVLVVSIEFEGSNVDPVFFSQDICHGSGIYPKYDIEEEVLFRIPYASFLEGGHNGRKQQLFVHLLTTSATSKSSTHALQSE
eukprot:767124-Hanusia_phi.AAC.3